MRNYEDKEMMIINKIINAGLVLVLVGILVDGYLWVSTFGWTLDIMSL